MSMIIKGWFRISFCCKLVKLFIFVLFIFLWLVYSLSVNERIKHGLTKNKNKKVYFIFKIKWWEIITSIHFHTFLFAPRPNTFFSISS